MVLEDDSAEPVPKHFASVSHKDVSVVIESTVLLAAKLCIEKWLQVVHEFIEEKLSIVLCGVSEEKPPRFLTTYLETRQKSSPHFGTLVGNSLPSEGTR